MDAETRAAIESWLADPEIDAAARALLLIQLDRESLPSLISAEEAGRRADMLHRENAARIEELLAEHGRERTSPP